jgi:hypothetical protein
MTWWLDIIFHLRTPLGEVGFHIKRESVTKQKAYLC